MIGRSRIRRIAKWTGLTLCVMLGVGWLVSLRFRMTIEKGGVLFGIGDGCLAAAMDAEGAPTIWMIPSQRIDWLPIVESGSFVLVPMWIPFLAIALPTAYLFWRDHRHPPGHCKKCGYDLTGNVSGVCPECGNRIVGSFRRGAQ